MSQRTDGRPGHTSSRQSPRGGPRHDVPPGATDPGFGDVRRGAYRA